MRRKFRKREEKNRSSDTEIQQHNGNAPLHDVSTPEEKELTQEEINELKKNAQELPLRVGIIDESITMLLSEAKKGKNCFIEWNGKRVYTYEIITCKSSDEAFDYVLFKLTGQTQLDREKEREEKRKKEELEKKKEELETLEKIPWRIEEGKKYIDEAKWEDWENKVNDCVTNEMGSVLDGTLEILRMIELGESWENVQEAFKNQGHSGWSYNYLKNCVVYFSRKGKEADIYL